MLAATAPAATLGQRVYAARRRANLTIGETAQAAGVPEDAIAQAEAEHPVPARVGGLDRSPARPARLTASASGGCGCGRRWSGKCSASAAAISMNLRRVAGARSRGPGDDPARSQVPVERHLDDHLSLSGELLGKDSAGALVGVTVGVVEYHDRSPEQAVSTRGWPASPWSGRRRPHRLPTVRRRRSARRGRAAPPA